MLKKRFAACMCADICLIAVLVYLSQYSSIATAIGATIVMADMIYGICKYRSITKEVDDYEYEIMD